MTEKENLGATPQRSQEAGSIASDAASHAVTSPGPWTVLEAWYDGPLFYINDANGVGIAGVSMDRIEGIDRCATDKANAHLIAAAPEVKEALKQLIRVVNHLVEEYPAHPAHAYVSHESSAMKAIAKAEGKQAATGNQATTSPLGSVPSGNQVSNGTSGSVPSEAQK